jgi:hypothetical protein
LFQRWSFPIYPTQGKNGLFYSVDIKTEGCPSESYIHYTICHVSNLNLKKNTKYFSSPCNINRRKYIYGIWYQSVRSQQCKIEKNSQKCLTCVNLISHHLWWCERCIKLISLALENSFVWTEIDWLRATY